MKENNGFLYDNEIFGRLKESLDLKKEQGALGSLFKRPIWWVVSDGSKAPLVTEEQVMANCKKMKTCRPGVRQACMKVFFNAFRKAKKTKEAEFFRCISGLHGFAYPIIMGKKIYGYIAMCHAEKEVPRQVVQIFAGFVNALVKETQKELELSKLYETIRPRAIALSTVHTVHRLISSTLDLDELLPRIARLSLHVVRANRCSIKLVDKARKTLLPKTTVDLRKKKVRLKKVKIGRHGPGRAFKKAKCIKGEGYLSVPLIDEDVIGVITLYDKVDGKAFTDFDQEIMLTLSEQAVIAIKNAQLYKEQERLTTGTIKSLAMMLRARSPGIITPRESFVRIVIEMGREFKMIPHDLRGLQYATLLHDAGEIEVPDRILKKPGGLTGKEFKLVKEHPLMGVKIIKPLKALKGVAPIIMHHHENYDGTGYPKGLRKNQIPIGARIMAIVAAFEAMVTKRPYRTRKTIKSAVEEIRKNSGTQFDPKAVDAFLKVVKRKHIRTLLRREGYGA